MDNSRIYLSLSAQSGFEQKYVQKALETNWITSGGPNVDDFEIKLENYFNKKSFVTALNSGTSAIHLALILLNVKAGDEVICQSMTFSASANPILYQGAVPVFVDSESDTWNICPENLEIAIKDRIAKGKKPKAIIAVHLYGIPYKVDEVHAIADRYEIPIIEDSAEALGSTYKGKKCGSFGSFGILSFNGNKIITTSSGGALITDSKKIKDKAIFYSNQSKDIAVHYQHSEIGYNYRMSNICAGIGLGQIKILDKNVEARRKNHFFYKEIFKEIENVELSEVLDETHFSNFWLNTILIKPSNNINKEGLRTALENANIESRPLWKPMHLQPIFCKYPYYGGKIAEGLFDNGLCLPSGSNLTIEDKDRIRKVIEEFFN
ncbi:DegT/DnrJ/EryC1/StrS family aminotransferase [Flavobacterium johnsoniae]|jgi:dTDP-4-amino-4,6-dideoxygalactose transaminase|uniref:DegT/DnrJ/EryC1/StrS aminotransferase n=1 Tax=Flavobacterium johnsoniae (strain ATCC 17061 / DSM 2064 / JCM 8514 / BCRC 14874 / CCUG 350202 / NBRC 14942 / NCIMB 11054 / UW101) TaxID=376686 RepID=A5FN49_FLAJ1|nr:DegT/DnrJ/EryC1/StrS family aminotransferase [Flavobacterium johnsoniae]ABQ03370.1 DegT/DnrJ/EryC1/StrS aminotransferase [Flavobacterium johnsoniae UW101]OXG01214.1 pyridoxal phosphate-dependent aminotransferase [Flavobacterium johnsoniae UW101]WQG79765.1 DegT/DnrJ/EryC1/StrS family aminotransferase [Flavobacterium johnsoniae UW101]SHL77171.1 dTDP-4-amino-4,6-dideoxygalactose transaminase [Flavobacterium johnsoniae]